MAVEAKPIIKRQRHGIDSQSLTVSLPGVAVTAVRRLADEERVSVSRVVADAITVYLTLKRHTIEERAS